MSTTTKRQTRKPRKPSAKRNQSNDVAIISQPETKSRGALSLNDPSDVMAFANTLKKFIFDNKLSSVIQDKNYVFVDGWKFAGINFGIVPIVDEPVQLLDGETLATGKKEIKYKCSCRLVRADGVVVGTGFALCSNKEHKKRNFDEYAIASMAQTRAIGKAFRNMIGFIMSAAGFESTPAEEMDEKYAAGNKSTGPDDETLQHIADQLMLITDKESLVKYFEQDDMKSVQQNPTVLAMFTKRKQEIDATSTPAQPVVPAK